MLLTLAVLFGLVVPFDVFAEEEEPATGSDIHAICNIFGEVLGLNKIADSANLDANEKIIAKRYLPVSVERGWTSKRDFVGYYNSLSKTFDKTNRRVSSSV